jgi:hypothetical protein
LKASLTGPGYIAAVTVQGCQVPRYFFDVLVNGVGARDHDGLDLNGPGEARRQIMRTLSEIARDLPTNADDNELVATVRDGGGAIYRAVLSLRVMPG